MRTVLHAGTTFFVTDDAGEVASGAEGLYFQDARFLHRLHLSVDGRSTQPLSAFQPSPRESVHVATNPRLDGAAPNTLAITRRRRLTEHRLTEDLAIRNYGDKEAEFLLEIDTAADFDGIFEVKSGSRAERATNAGGVEPSIANDGRQLRYRRERSGKQLETIVELSEPGEAAVRSTDGLARFPLVLARHQQWRVKVDVTMQVDGRSSSSKAENLKAESARRHAQRLREASPVLESDHEILRAAYDRASADLIALRVKAAESAPYEIAGGIPWYMALFGRDGLITSYQTMLHDPTIARGTLRALASLQGTHTDDDTLEQPGRILHEYRSGLTTGAGRAIPRFPYFGTVDATPLFLIVLGEYARATGDLQLVRDLWGHAERALSWIGEWGDRDGDGLLEYDPGPGSWLQNLCWKDSADSIRFRDGSIARPPIAPVEVQGYVVEAYRSMGRLMDVLDKPGGAELRRRAQTLARAINDRFWMADRAYFAEALDGSKARVDALTSNPGHLLWAGAVSSERAARVAEVLLSAEMFSGFGIRTMGSGEGGYNPISYHNGSVWPHDNSLILRGFARYRLGQHADKLAHGLLAALGTYPGARWPELFDGYDRTTFPRPVAFAGANSPQAWATGAVMLLVRTLLGLSVDALARTIELRPVALDGATFVRVRGLPVAGHRIDVEVRFDGGAPQAHVSGLPDGWTRT